MSTRRSFFGRVLGGLAVALGVKAAPAPDLSAYLLAQRKLDELDTRPTVYSWVNREQLVALRPQLSISKLDHPIKMTVHYASKRTR